MVAAKVDEGVDVVAVEAHALAHRRDERDALLGVVAGLACGAVSGFVNGTADWKPLLGEAPPLRNTYGGTPLGLIFGSVAFLIFLFASALGIRKKQRTWPIGSVQFWLKALA